MMDLDADKIIKNTRDTVRAKIIQSKQNIIFLISYQTIKNLLLKNSHEDTENLSSQIKIFEQNKLKMKNQVGLKFQFEHF